MHDVTDHPDDLLGFGNLFATEAREGVLPPHQNSPQQVAGGLYAEQLSGTAFTAPRAHNQRSWLYRLQPSAEHGPFEPADDVAPGWRTGPVDTPPTPNRQRWNPLPPPEGPTTLLQGVRTLAVNGSPEGQIGVGVHRYVANASMVDTAFFSADGELMFVPQSGALRIVTELGVLEVGPGWIGVVPRGVRLRVELLDEVVSGYLCENHGAPFVLPELGPIGANGLANPSDFRTPPAAYEDVQRPTRLVQKLSGHFYATMLDRSPFDVVAWRGNLAPYRYELKHFNTINTVSYDHPDPSIFTVLTSPSGRPGVANCDFVIFGPRWMVAEHSFRPPWFHRNVMSELMGLVHGEYDAKAGGFAPGAASLHNVHSAHGPDRATFETASRAELVPHKIDHTLAFMFETCLPYRVVPDALACPTRQADYDAVWSGFRRGQG
jgi:homogentisate 1,2-dioxygenase